jgi:hypothetical protein
MDIPPDRRPADGALTWGGYQNSAWKLSGKTGKYVTRVQWGVLDE